MDALQSFTEQVVARCLHLVRIDDFEYYFFELEDAIAKMVEAEDAIYERITLH